MRHTRPLFIIIISIFFLTAIVGCQSTASFYQGKLVEPEHVIPIPGGVQNETWQSSDLTINYSYQEDSKNFHISGEVEMSDHYREIYTRLSRINLHLLFLDHNSRVLEASLLIDSSAYDTDEIMPFEAQLIIPASAVAYSFAYDGTALEYDGRKRVPAYFWLRPK